MLITNKDKQSGKSERKTETARLMRHTASAFTEELQEIRYRRTPRAKGDLRTMAGTCPVCLASLARNGKGTRHQRSCTKCGACLAPDLLCTHCMTKRVWRGKKGSFCKGCGRPHIRISASKIKHA